jgi:hypothetical protein
MLEASTSITIADVAATTAPRTSGPRRCAGRPDGGAVGLALLGARDRGERASAETIPISLAP